MSGRGATTTHKQLGFRLTPIDFKQVLHQVREAQVADLIIVEEISMLPKVLYKTLMELLDSGRVKKILFLGDPLQLPAVSDGIDISDIDGTVIELTQPMRQDPSKAELISYLKSMRLAIETEDEDFNPMPDFDDVQVVESHREFCKLYNACEGNKKILAHRNSIVDKYNKYINGGQAFNVHDEVILDKPLGDSTNGSTVIVADVEELHDRYVLKVVDNFGKAYTIYNFKSKSALDSILDKYQSEDDKDSYWNLLNMSFKLKHVYASTIYKSQGSTYDTVFIDASDLVSAYTCEETFYKKPISYDLFLRLLYVAISRMTTRCYLFVGDKREYKYLIKDTHD